MSKTQSAYDEKLRCVSCVSVVWHKHQGRRLTTRNSKKTGKLIDVEVHIWACERGHRRTWNKPGIRVWELKPPSTAKCCICDHNLLPDAERISEMRPTGYMGKEQIWFYCLPCAPKLATPNEIRAERFKSLAKALLGDPNVPDYHTGRDSRFQRRNGPSGGVNKIPGIGPVFKTPQWVRTVN